MSTEPNQAPEPEVVPSSTPDGPSVIPAEGTPEGEPGPDPAADIKETLRASNPNSAGPEGLAGDMGVSSERTGPEGSDPRNVGTGLGGAAGTGTKGTSKHRTDGELDTSAEKWDSVDVSQGAVHPYRDPDKDDTRGVNEQRDDYRAGVDRTVGEPRPNSIPDEKLRR